MYTNANLEREPGTLQLTPCNLLIHYMPKPKTHKATAKRYRVTGNKKTLTVERRRAGQSHLNQKQRGKTERAKRRDYQPDTIKGFIKIALPNS